MPFVSEKPRAAQKGGPSFLSAAGAAAFLVVFRPPHGVRREELAHRERDVPENAAGVFVAASAAAGAFLVGHTIVIDRNQQLGIPFQTHNGELSQGDIDAAAVVSAGKLAVKAAVDEGRHFAQVAVTVPLAAAVHNPCVQDDGVHRFHDGNGEIRPAHELKVRFAGPQLGGEDFGVSFAAEQNGPFVEYAQALHRDGDGTAQIGLQAYRVEETHIDGIETPVEADGFHIDVDV